MNLDTLRTAIEASWARDTSDDPDNWTSDVPSFGQCAVTSLVVRDYVGGEVRIARVFSNGEAVDMHCWLELPDGDVIDWTTEQFDFEYELGEPLDLTPIVDDTGVDRHRLLAGRVTRALADTITPSRELVGAG
ncbi:MAG: hypothetical protein ABWZ99_10675 [Ilumatobacteraceae bacterium]